MDIYITGKNSKGNDQKIQIPIIPEEIESSIEGKFAEYDIYKLGQVSVPNGKNLSELSWECFFPGEARKGMKFVRKWTDPATLDALMKYWAKYGKVVNVCITGTKINVDMRVSEYDSTVKSLNDYYYTVRFIDYEKISVFSTKRSTKTTKKKVKVKKGQTMLNQFSRTELLFGKEAMDILENSRVAVFGVGGVGGYTVEALVRSGVGAIDVIDDDKVCLTNLNRQIIATRKTIGQYKTDVCKERIHDINPNCEVTVHKCFFLPETKDQFDFSKYDYVVDAVDTVTAKIALVMACQEAGTPIISSMGAGNKLNPAEFEVADIYKTSVCPLAKVMRRELKKRNVKHLKVVYSKEKPVRPIEDMGISCRTNCICPPGAAHKCTERRDIPGSTAFVPSVVGLIIASEVIKDITHDAMVKTRHENGVDIEG